MTHLRGALREEHRGLAPFDERHEHGRRHRIAWQEPSLRRIDRVTLPRDEPLRFRVAWLRARETCTDDPRPVRDADGSLLDHRPRSAPAAGAAALDAAAHE